MAGRALVWAENDVIANEQRTKAILEKSGNVTYEPDLLYERGTKKKFLLHKEHQFELAPDVFYQTFKQTGDDYALKRTGAFYGLYSSYNFRPLDAQDWPINVFHIDVQGNYGQVDYDFKEDGKVESVSNYIVEPRVWLGKDVDLNNVTVTPYTGVGYRWQYERLQNKFVDESDPDTEMLNQQSQYVYIPLGAEFSVTPVLGWRIVFGGEYDFLVWGRVTHYLSDFDSSLPDIHSTLDKGNGLRGSIKLVKEGEVVNFFVEPYFHYLNIKKSKEATAAGVTLSGLREDPNKTTEIGTRVGVQF